MKYWAVFEKFVSYPPDQRRKVYSTVAAEPHVSEMLAEAGRLDSEGFESWGTAKHRIEWGPSTLGQKSVVVKDCQNQDYFGIRNRSTGKKLTRGETAVNIQATLQVVGGAWRVVGIVQVPGGC